MGNTLHGPEGSAARGTTASRSSSKRTTAELVRRAREKFGDWRHTATDDDFIALCLDPKRDVWMAFPVSRQEAGLVTHVHTQTDGRVSASSLHRGPHPQMFMDGSRVDTDQAYERCWREFAGLAALRDEMSKALRRDGDAKLSSTIGLSGSSVSEANEGIATNPSQTLPEGRE